MRSPQAGEVWRHYKGNRYRVNLIGTNEADKAPVVVYYRADGSEDTMWVRPVSSWLEEIDDDGSRFELVEEAV